MNTLLAISLAQSHVDSLVANAAASRRAKDARLVRRAQRRAARHRVADAAGC
jgi:hypothetical protein